MKLSTRARYGIHAMYDLAQNYGAQPRPIKAVAEAQTIPEAYLEQLLCTLRRAGLVVSARGAQGGYMLSPAAGGNYRGRHTALFGGRADAAGLSGGRGRLRQELRLPLAQSLEAPARRPE